MMKAIQNSENPRFFKNTPIFFSKFSFQIFPAFFEEF